jgi:hypothetical protein
VIIVLIVKHIPVEEKQKKKCLVIIRYILTQNVYDVLGMFSIDYHENNKWDKEKQIKIQIE